MSVENTDLLPECREHTNMLKRVLAIFENELLATVACEDATHTFTALGLEQERARELFAYIQNIFFSVFCENLPLPDIEQKILARFASTKIGDRNIVQILDEKLADRAEIIYSQISPHLQNIHGKALDFGAGDLQVTQMLQDRDGLEIQGVDVRYYRKQGAMNPVGFTLYDGNTLSFNDRYFAVSVATNVLHHAGETDDGPRSQNNEQALSELCRVTRQKLVIIETVPDPDYYAINAKGAMERTFWNDYLYNRLFHNADVPVPGRYETLEGWPARFNKYGFRVISTIPLAYDQPTIRDYHVLYVLEHDSTIR